jgi:hypothetical protein
MLPWHANQAIAQVQLQEGGHDAKNDGVTKTNQVVTSVILVHNLYLLMTKQSSGAFKYL